jgi:hypothetical protein
MRLLSEYTVDRWFDFHRLLFKLNLVPQYYEAGRIGILLSKLENDMCIMDHTERNEHDRSVL